PRHWRRYRSRSAVAVLARNSVASVQRAWHAFTHRLVDYARSARIAPFSVFERPAPPSVPSRSAVNLNPVPAEASPAPVVAPKPVARTANAPTSGESSQNREHWRRNQSRSAVAVFPRSSVASVQRAGHAFSHPFVDYAHSVSHSFIRDCRLMFRALTLSTPALELGSSANGATAKSAIHRSVLAPIVHWLRQ